MDEAGKKNSEWCHLAREKEMLCVFSFESSDRYISFGIRMRGHEISEELWNGVETECKGTQS